MQTENNFFDELKHQYNYGGMTIKLIFINLIVFLLISILDVFSRILGPTVGQYITLFVGDVFTMRTDLWGFITHPWGLFTSIFSHVEFLHILWNMIFLYTAGRMFEQLFDGKRLLYTYILGGLLGGLLELLVHVISPVLSSAGIIGASGSIMAILVAIAFHRPKTVVFQLGNFKIYIIYLAIGFILRDLYNAGSGGNVAHFAHLGGAIIGMISIQRPYSSSNIVVVSQKIGDKIAHFLSVIFRPTKTPKMKVAKKNTSSNTSSARFKTDEEYNMEAKARQQKIDIILDKIAKSGYESLNKDEKDFLFRQSKNG